MTAVLETTIDNSIAQTLADLKKRAIELRTKPLAHRKEKLNRLRNWIHQNKSAIHQAMYDDFRKNPVEVDGIEIFHVLSEIKLAVSHLEEWAAAKKVDAPLTMLGTRSFIQYEPRGVCLIISPWNYPFSLAVGPLISAIAAGNAVVMKPSELTPNVSGLLARMVCEVFTDGSVAAFEGGPEISKQLLSLPFDHIFFTGSPAIGKIVMKAAAEHLTSVTLELGGKSPTIVTDSANINDAAERSAVAKFVNNGQTCVAPDYILVDEKIADKFMERFIQKTEKLFAQNGSFENSGNYCRIVNERHFNRLNEILQDALQRGATLRWGGKTNPESRFMHPVVLTNVAPDARVMEEEIFGPIIPIVTYKKIEDAVAVINSKPKALALYVFTTSSKIRNLVLNQTSSGGVCINDCGIHFLHHNLPFGGVNNSGIGKSHGHFGFLAFSNEKPVLKQRSGFTSVKAFYPPYTAASKKLMDWFLKLF
jgi:aldehyde dehydrogenase (NAD+)